MFILKIIACITMLIDHIGYSYGIEFFRIIGRISFPIFAFLITSGYIHTKNLNKYFMRLFIFSLLVEIPYNYFINGNLLNIGLNNIFFTLTLGLLSIHIYKLMMNSKYKKLTFIPIFMICLLGGFLKVSYGFMGVLLILTFYIFRNSRKKAAIAFFILTLLPVISYYLIPSNITFVSLFIPFNYSIDWLWVQTARLFALIPIFLYNGQKGYIAKSKIQNKCIQYAFYLFYPIHIIILALLTRY